MKPSERIKEIHDTLEQREGVFLAIEDPARVVAAVLRYLDEQHAAGLALDQVVDEVRDDSTGMITFDRPEATTPAECAACGEPAEPGLMLVGSHRFRLCRKCQHERAALDVATDIGKRGNGSRGFPAWSSGT